MSGPARFPRAPTAAAAVFVVVVIAGLVVPVDLSGMPPLGHAFLAALPFPVFVLVTVAIAVLLARRGEGDEAGGSMPWIAPAVLAALVAVVTEGVQGWTGRPAAAADLVPALLGVVVGAGALAAWGGRAPRWVRIVHAVVAVAATVVVLREPVAAVGWRERRLPVLGDFESRTDLVFWRPFGEAGRSRTRRWSASGRWALNVATAEAGWSGVRFGAGALPARTTDDLVLDFRNEGPPFLLGIRIDLADGRVIQEAHPVRHREDTVLHIRLEPTRATDVTIEGRTPDPDGDPVEIAGITLHTGSAGGAREFLVDDVRVVSYATGEDPDP